MSENEFFNNIRNWQDFIRFLTKAPIPNSCIAEIVGVPGLKLEGSLIGSASFPFDLLTCMCSNRCHRLKTPLVGDKLVNVEVMFQISFFSSSPEKTFRSCFSNFHSVKTCKV